MSLKTEILRAELRRIESLVRDLTEDESASLKSAEGFEAALIRGGPCRNADLRKAAKRNRTKADTARSAVEVYRQLADLICELIGDAPETHSPTIWNADHKRSFYIPA